MKLVTNVKKNQCGRENEASGKPPLVNLLFTIKQLNVKFILLNGVEVFLIPVFVIILIKVLQVTFCDTISVQLLQSDVYCLQTNSIIE